MATVSSTVTLDNNHLCITDGTDIICGERGATLSASGDISVTTLTTISSTYIPIAGAAPVSNTSVSGSGGADNLGDHTATEDLVLGGYNISNVENVQATGSVQVGVNDTTCSGAADNGKIIWDVATGRARICRP